MIIFIKDGVGKQGYYIDAVNNHSIHYSSELNLERSPLVHDKPKETASLCNPYMATSQKTQSARPDQAAPPNRQGVAKPPAKPIDYPFLVSDCELARRPLPIAAKGYPEVYSVPEPQVAPVRTASILSLSGPLQLPVAARPVNREG